MIESEPDQPVVRQQGATCGTVGSARDVTERPPRKRMSEHRGWLGMRQRCENPHEPNFKYYGGRGIMVCPARRGSQRGCRPTFVERPFGIWYAQAFPSELR